MSVIAATEDAMVDAVRALLGQRLRTVGSVPASFSAQELHDRLRGAPAVYVGFLGGQAVPSDTAVVLDARFAVYALTQSAAGEQARRRGDAVSIGAYDIIEAVSPRLHGLRITAGDPPVAVEGTGTLTFVEAANLWAEELDRAGVSLYSATFGIQLAFAPPDIDRLGVFATFVPQYDVPPFGPRSEPLSEPDTSVDAEDHVSLPTA